MHRFWRVFVAGIIICMILYLVSAGIGGGSTSAVMLALSLPWLLLMTDSLGSCFVITIGTFYSMVLLPGLPGSLNLFFLAASLCTGLMVVNHLLKVPSRLPHSSTSVWLIGYLVIVLITMYARGFSLRATGSSAWGGKSYVQLIVICFFYLTSGVVVLRERQIRAMIILFFCLSLIPSLAELLYVLSRGEMAWVYAFVQQDVFSSAGSVAALEKGGLLRFQMLRNMGNLFVLALALFPFRGRGKIIISISCVVGFIAVSLSGHRSAVLFLLLLLPVYMWLHTGKAPVRLISSYLIGLFVLFVFMLFAGRHLPLAVQRAFAWVPFVKWDWLATYSAAESWEWRLKVWERALVYLPSHWLLGRGFIFNIDDFYSMKWRPDAYIEWAVITHAYHSGPLSMLLDLGAGGLLCGSGTMLSGIIKHIKQVRTRWGSLFLARSFNVLLASLIVNVFRFFVVYGEASSSMVMVVVHLTMLMAIRRANQKMLQDRNVDMELPAERISYNSPAITLSSSFT